MNLPIQKVDTIGIGFLLYKLRKYKISAMTALSQVVILNVRCILAMLRLITSLSAGTASTNFAKKNTLQSGFSAR
ncbi:hypothetical protein JUJ52_22320, partial [Virgibacillus sp. AGTR]|uniref:hypothetical protein n=1 Tax=Virgibacillus sp. AGTR TaxID=2812055 RepID=UPI001D1651CF